MSYRLQSRTYGEALKLVRMFRWLRAHVIYYSLTVGTMKILQSATNVVARLMALNTCIV